MWRGEGLALEVFEVEGRRELRGVVDSEGDGEEEEVEEGSQEEYRDEL